MRDGRKLREQLLELNRLRHAAKKGSAGNAEKAAALAAALEPQAPVDEQKLDSLARQRVRTLRDTAFSFDGLELTREVLRRFCNMPEVRQLLTSELLEQQRDVVDAGTARELIKASKAFFGELLKQGASQRGQEASWAADR